MFSDKRRGHAPHRCRAPERARVMTTWYTVYEASTEEVIASGTSQQCAKALGMTMGVFYSTVSHAQAGINSKYTFYVEKLKKEDFSE